jgi:hypothetical protein
VIGKYRWVDDQTIAVEFSANGKTMSDRLKVQLDGDSLQTIDGRGKADQLTRAPNVVADGVSKGETGTGQRVHLTVEGVLIELTNGNRKWDGNGSPRPEDMANFRDAAHNFAAKSAADPRVAAGAEAAALSTAITSAVLGATEPPDPFGTAELLIDGRTVGSIIELKKQQDSYTPHWPGVEWLNVPLGANVNIRLQLADYDIGKTNDNIGTAILTTEDIRHAAAASGQVFAVPVRNPGSHIVYVMISAMPER